MNQTWNADFYYCAIIVLSVLCIYHFMTPKYKSMQNTLYGIFVSLSLLTCVADTLNSKVFYDYFPENEILLRFGYTVYFFAQHMLAPLFFLYILISARGRQGTLYKKDFLWMIPAVIVELLNLTSGFTGLIFRYSYECGYSRGPLWPLLIVVAGPGYMLMTFIYVIWQRKRLPAMIVLVTPVYILMNVLFITIQTLVPGLLLLGASGAVCCLIVQLGMQNPNMLKAAIEDAEEAKKEAEEANRSKSNFLANMSHEIRTPMNAICGMSELLAQRELGALELDYVNTIQVASKNLLEIINAILDVSKVDAGKVEIIPVEYRLDELLFETEQIIASRAAENHIEFYVHVDPAVPVELYGDNLKLKQILINILNNAVKFTEKGSVTLTVGGRVQDDGKLSLCFEIKDTGIGIKEEDIDKLFTQFSQVNSKRNRRVEGTGLGLALAKAYSMMMGGDVTVESVFGEGSCFTVQVIQELQEGAGTFSKGQIQTNTVYVLSRELYYKEQIERVLEACGVSFQRIQNITQLPENNTESDVLLYEYEVYYKDVMDTNLRMKKVAFLNFYTMVEYPDKETVYIRKPLEFYRMYALLTGREEKVQETIEEEKELDFSSLCVAVVDDSRVNLRIAKAFMNKLHMEPALFSSGYEIIEKIEQGERFDLIFMDHMMPEMDGIETMQKIRQMNNDYGEHVPIVALTANAVSGIDKEYLALGMDGCLFKPLVMDALKQELEKWL